MTVRETMRYRGSIGQWSWVLHRITGLGVVLFLVIHVIDTSWAIFYPALYEEAIASYQSPLFTIGEFALVACVIYHAFNGLRISIFDFRPDLWKYQQRAAWYVLGASIVVLVPVFLGMGSHVIEHYSEEGVFVQGIGDVIAGQAPFIAGMVAAVIAALIIGGIWNAVVGGEEVTVSAKHQGSKLERFWWSFMRVSGLLIIPLVFGHLALAHIIQGVFDLTLMGATVAGVPVTGTALSPGVVSDIANTSLATILNGLNDTGTATEYVLERWSFLLGGMAIWRVYDILLLVLVSLHGFNGLRYVLTDYTMKYPVLRRASIVLTIIGGITLVVVGGSALLTTVEADAIHTAQESICEINPVHADYCNPGE
ncbi:succinate dehydrogenase, cytochrome b556 subunit [Phototrophicus methaneseepsis]|uniref:Succinate dehydrogenase, cytochrome b556 subunit n=2 Tax=Phototrophicus methaneseepsis TaxID=2710758 RepID=A0A7S8IFV2_9CHLR|nr:succinate dehydrogenase, cytochrome b556 subunit [Phototrophicus methaneseepsis]